MIAQSITLGRRELMLELDFSMPMFGLLEKITGQDTMTYLGAFQQSDSPTVSAFAQVEQFAPVVWAAAQNAALLNREECSVESLHEASAVCYQLDLMQVAEELGKSLENYSSRFGVKSNSPKKKNTGTGK